MWKSILLPIVLVLVLIDMVSLQLIFKVFKNWGVLVYTLLLIFVFETYSFQAINTLSNKKWLTIVYIAVNVVLYSAFVYLMITARTAAKSSMIRVQSSLLILTLFVVPKLFLILPLILEDFVRVSDYCLTKINPKQSVATMPSRRKFVSVLALGLASIPFLGVLHGIIYGKWRFRVIKKTIFFDDLPQEFDGFTITQLSDIHCGSFNEEHRKKVEYGIQLANEQQSDILVFTGDMVNNSFTELEPWVDVFKNLTAKQGMFSVFGNHDYGGYGSMTKEEQLQSQKKIAALEQEMGFKVLSNQCHTFERNGKNLNIIGVENWGASRHFPKKGNLKKATASVGDADFNVLLSHDPSHFDFKEMELHDHHQNNPNYNLTEKPIVAFEKKIHLTLAGHTHGMQFGIEIPGLIKWSPVKFRYPKWAGLYQEKGRYLYVNRGFGYLAFAGRVGIWPEITVIELRRK